MIIFEDETCVRDGTPCSDCGSCRCSECGEPEHTCVCCQGRECHTCEHQCECPTCGYPYAECECEEEIFNANH